MVRRVHLPCSFRNIVLGERLRFTDYIWTTNWPYLLMCDAWMRPIKYNHVLLSKQPQFRHMIYEPYLTSRVQEFKLLPFSRQKSKRASRSLLLCNLSYIHDISVAHNLAFLRTATEPAGCWQKYERSLWAVWKYLKLTAQLAYIWKIKTATRNCWTAAHVRRITPTCFFI